MIFENNCHPFQWDEYEATQPYLQQLDLIIQVKMIVIFAFAIIVIVIFDANIIIICIQENLFKADEEDDKMKVSKCF